MKVYLDNSATTKVDSEAANLIYDVMTKKYGNPSSLHGYGVTAEEYVNKVRSFIFKTLKSYKGNFIFTSGGTEANNLAIKGAAYRQVRKGKHLITTQVEHPSVLNVFKCLEHEGYHVTYLPVDGQGRVKLEELKDSLTENTTLVSVQAVNNEVGTVQPIYEIGEILKNSRSVTLFHSDSVQAIGKIDCFPEEAGVHLMSISAHKFHGPKGIGGLYISPDVMLKPLFEGGGQEDDIRPGTENVPGIVGMGKALEKLFKNRQKFYQIKKHKKKMYEMIKGKLGEKVKLIGPKIEESAPHILSLGFLNIKGEVMVHALEKKGVYVSSGSACRSNKDSESSVLASMELPEGFRQGGIRISFSYNFTEPERAYAVEQIIACYHELKHYSKG